MVLMIPLILVIILMPMEIGLYSSNRGELAFHKREHFSPRHIYGGVGSIHVLSFVATTSAVLVVPYIFFGGWSNAISCFTLADVLR